MNCFIFFFFFNDTATTEIYTLSLHDALPIWAEFVDYDARYERPAEAEALVGDATKAREALGWEPKVKFKELVQLMVDADLELAEREKRVQEAGG